MNIKKIKTSTRIIFLLPVLLFTINAFAALSSNTNSDVRSEATTDQVITQTVQQEIAADEIVKNLSVTVSTKDGVVKLKGHVNTDNEVDKLIEIASSVNGVDDVDATNLVIKKSHQPLTDTTITAKVKGTFIREKLFGDVKVTPMSIHVETKDGVVYLTGTADTRQQADNAVKLATAVKGVKSVNSKITVKS